jgi:hypothetical protein
VNKKVVVIHQPDFVPYLGFFHRLLYADVFVILDHVQMSKRGWVHRDKIKTKDGAAWISVPIHGLASGPIIKDAQIDRNGLYEKLPRVIKSNYAGARHFSSLFPAVENALSNCDGTMINLNMSLLQNLLNWFDISVPIVYSSELGIASKASLMNAEITKAVGGEVYLSGIGAKDYHEQECFDRLGIEVIWQNFTHPVYEQQFGEFIPYLSALDLLFNHGVEASREILRRCG